MKKYIVIALTLVLTAALFAGCRRMDDTGNTSAPTVDTTPMDTESTGGTDATMMPEDTDMGTNPAGRRIPGGR